MIKYIVYLGVMGMYVNFFAPKFEYLEYNGTDYKIECNSMGLKVFIAGGVKLSMYREFPDKKCAVVLEMKGDLFTRYRSNDNGITEIIVGEHVIKDQKEHDTSVQTFWFMMHSLILLFMISRDFKRGKSENRVRNGIFSFVVFVILMSLVVTYS